MSKLPAVFADPEDSQLVADAKKQASEDSEFSYTLRDVILYNLGIGATEQERQWTFEGDDSFSALPTFGVVPQFAASAGLSLGWLPNYNPVCSSDRILCPIIPCLTPRLCSVLPCHWTIMLAFLGRGRQNFYTENSTCPSRLLYLLRLML